MGDRQATEAPAATNDRCLAFARSGQLLVSEFGFAKAIQQLHAFLGDPPSQALSISRLAEKHGVILRTANSDRFQAQS